MTGKYTLERHNSPFDFRQAAGKFLESKEAENNLILGILSDLETSVPFGAESPYFARVHSNGETVGAAIRTPPFGVVLSSMQESASASAFVADLLDRYSALPGALGPPPVAKSFADSWIARTGGVARLARHERIHQCDRVIDPPAVPGSIREINDSDLTLLLRWMRQFSLEVFPEQNPADAQLLDTIQRRRSASDGGFFVWEVAGELVTMAACGGRTPNGIRVGPVYTPPERRTLGYATALVAAVTSLMLQRGLRFCCLFTDLSNPTSNSIYRKVGYVPVTDIDQYAFDSR